MFYSGITFNSDGNFVSGDDNIVSMFNQIFIVNILWKL